MEQPTVPRMTPTEPESPSQDRSLPAPPMPAPADVTQDELRRLQAGLRQRRETEQLRKSILERMSAGAHIEAGPLTVEIEEKQVRQITRSVLERFWGQHYVENLRQHLPCTVRRHLRATDQLSLIDL